MATNQPGGLDAATDLFVYANRASSTLNGAVSDVDTTLTVVDGTQFPGSGRFVVTIENEIIIIASRTGNDLFVESRGAESTTAVAHADAALVAMQFTAGVMAATRDAVIATQEGHVRYPDAHTGEQGLIRHGTDEFENVRRFCL